MMKKSLVTLVVLSGGAALLLSGGCMNVAKKMQEAEAAYKAGRFPTACEATAKVLKKDPSNISAMVLNGWSLHQQGKDTEALPMLAKAAQAGRDDFAAQYFYGSLLADAGDYTAALPPLREAYRINPNSEPLLVLLGRCCLELNLLEGTKYLQILRRYPDMQADPNLYNNLGILWTNNQKYDLAATAFKDAWAKDPHKFLAPQNLAVIYDQYLKNPRTALSYYRACANAAIAEGDTVRVDSYKNRIAALERENPRTPPAVKPHGATTGKGTTAKTGSKTGTTKGTTAKTGSKTTSSKTGTKTGTTSKPTAKKTTTTTLAH